MIGLSKPPFVAPQFAIYTSRNDVSLPVDPELSVQTAADSAATGVYVDVAIVLPVVVLDDPEATRDEAPRRTLETLLANACRSGDDFQPRRACLIALYVPVLMELKPGPPRHLKNLADYVNQIIRSTQAAQAQAVDQSICLFASCRFSKQSTVRLAAGPGDYYSVCLYTRGQATIAFQKYKWTASKMHSKY